MEREIATAGASNQGASANARPRPAWKSIAPQLAEGSENPSPTNDKVASARINAGTRSDAWTESAPREAGKRWCSRMRDPLAPAARADSAYSRFFSIATTARTVLAANGHPTIPRITVVAQKAADVVRTRGMAALSASTT